MLTGLNSSFGGVRHAFFYCSRVDYILCDRCCFGDVREAGERARAARDDPVGANQALTMAPETSRVMLNFGFRLAIVVALALVIFMLSKSPYGVG